MRVLLDSNVLIWAIFEPHRTGKQSAKMLATLERGYVSRASLLEHTFKHGTGKLPYTPQSILEGAALVAVTVLEIDDTHLQAYASVTTPHKDPFDQLLVAQALAENLTFITADAALLATTCQTLDARL